MQPLSNLDASFLHLESENTPMHIGGVLIFGPSGTQQMTPQRFRNHIRNRLYTSRIFRQRLIMPVFNLGLPCWIEDPHFSLDEHLSYVQIEQPIDHQQMQPLAEAFFKHPLERSKPLWEIRFVQGPHSGTNGAAAFAVILKVHHSACDGLSAKEILTGLLDAPSQQRPQHTDQWHPDAIPTQLGVIGRQLLASNTLLQQLRETLTRTYQSAKAAIELRLHDQSLRQPVYFNAPATPFSKPISSSRTFLTAQLSLTTIKTIKNRFPGLTVNDIVLAICGGALRHYLHDRGELPKTPLIAMAPISKRVESEKHSMGNQVSAMLIALATDEHDPLIRLKKIHENACRAKRYNEKVAVENILPVLPSVPMAAALNLFSRLRLNERLKPIFNVVITNVAGSPLPLNLEGFPLVSLTTLAPIYSGMGLTLVVMSYLDTTVIGITSTPEMLKDGNRFVELLHEQLNLLDLATTQTMSVDKGPPATGKPIKAPRLITEMAVV